MKQPDGLLEHPPEQEIHVTCRLCKTPTTLSIDADSYPGREIGGKACEVCQGRLYDVTPLEGENKWPWQE